MKKIGILLSSWWKRIIAFIVLNLLLIWVLEIIDYNTDYLSIGYLFSISLVLVVSSSIIEYLRCCRQVFLWGLIISRNTFAEIISGIILSAFPFIFIWLYLQISNSEIVHNSIDNYSFLIITAFIFFSALIEELIFRGIIFQAIAERFGYVITILSSGLIFAIGHTLNPNSSTIAFINTFLAGVLFGLMYWKTKSLYLSVFYHFFWNFSLAFFINSPVSGYDFGISLISFTFSNLNHILFGGAYGFEAGILCTIWLILTIVIVIKLLRPSPFIESKISLRNIEESKYF